MSRYRQIHWPFYHQFVVITTVKIHPYELQPEKFSLQTVDGRKILLDDLDPVANGISFRIDRRSRRQPGDEPTNELEIWANLDSIEIIRPGNAPLGGPEASDFDVTWCLTRKPHFDPTPFSLRVRDIGLFVQWLSQINKVQCFPWRTSSH
jgi:hypothetical protein